MNTNYTYDVHFNDEYDSNNKGMNATIEECRDRFHVGADQGQPIGQPGEGDLPHNNSKTNE